MRSGRIRHVDLFVSQTNKKLEEYLSWRLEELELAALMVDDLEGCRTHRRRKSRNGASAIKCCYAAAGSGTGAEESGLRAPVSRKTSIRDHKGIVVAKKMSRKVSRRVVRSACIAGVRISRPNFRAPCGRTKL